jgi:hypothetical protein
MLWIGRDAGGYSKRLDTERGVGQGLSRHVISDVSVLHISLQNVNETCWTRLEEA